MDYMEKYYAERAATKAKFTDPENLKTLKAEIAQRLNAHQLEEFIITFDGYGDSGQIEDSTLEDPWFDNLAYQILEVFHAGWENNEGAYGTITFKPTEIDYDFNFRTTSSEYDGHQL